MRVDLYLDETGNAGISKNFTIGGIYIAGPSNGDDWNCFNERAKTEYKQMDEKTLPPFIGQALGRQAPDHVTLDYLTNQIDLRSLENKIKKLERDNLDDHGRGRLNRLRQQHRTRKSEAHNNKHNIRKWMLDEIRRNFGLNQEMRIQAIQLTDKNSLNNDYRRKVREILSFICNRDVNGLRGIYEQFITVYADKFNDENTVSEKLDEMQINMPCNLDFIIKQYTHSHDRHLEVLKNLIKLFLFVILPALEDELENQFGEVTSVNILCGTVSRTTYNHIAERLDNINSLDTFNSCQKSLQFIEPNLVALKNGIGYNERDYNLKCVPFVEFSYLHHAADALLSNPGEQSVQDLYRLGMKDTMDNLNKFSDVMGHLCNKNYSAAFEELKENDPWEAVICKRGNNTACSHICKFLAKKIKIS